MILNKFNPFPKSLIVQGLTIVKEEVKIRRTYEDSGSLFFYSWDHECRGGVLAMDQVQAMLVLNAMNQVMLIVQHVMGIREEGLKKIFFMDRTG